MNEITFDEMEQDLILACKCHYNLDRIAGIKSVIGYYCHYPYQQVTLKTIYHFISELYIKLIDNHFLSIRSLLQHTGLAEIKKTIIECMILEIQLMTVNNEDGNPIIKLKDTNDKIIADWEEEE